MKKTLLRRLLAAALLLCALFTFAGCENFGGDASFVPPFAEDFAMKTTDDGWVYMYSYHINKDGSEIEDESIITSSFRIFNIRYAYTEDHLPTLEIKNGTALSRDLDKVADILYKKPFPDKAALLRLDREAVTFEAIDGDIFFDLIKTALNGDVQPVGKWSVYPENGIMREPEYKDGYALQFGFVCEYGVFEASFIDVLYPTGDEPYEYAQLSDMVDDGTASPEQKELFRTLSIIARGIVVENDLYFGSGEYRAMETAGVKLERLYDMFGKLDDERGLEYAFDAPADSEEPIG